MKYPKNAQYVEAEYTPGTYNPFVAALPPLCEADEFIEQIAHFPPLPEHISRMSYQERYIAIQQTQSFFYPLGYMYKIYLTLYSAMLATYQSMNYIDSVKRINALYQSRYTADGGLPVNNAILGFPGIGKTSTIQRCLSLFPQVIEHSKFNNQAIMCKQILYLRVECPSDCSVKTIAINILSAINLALGYGPYNPGNVSRISTSAFCQNAKSLCLTYHVGFIAIDEIQNIITYAANKKQTRTLIKFLVELTNDTNTSICFIGTPAAEEFLSREEHLCRRTRGLRLLPFKYNAAYLSFTNALWQYQYTDSVVDCSAQMSKELYRLSGGIPAYMEIIFREAQIIALDSQIPHISSALLRDAAENLAIHPPEVHGQGKSISDFDFPISQKKPKLMTDSDDHVIKKEIPPFVTTVTQGNQTDTRHQIHSNAIPQKGRKKVQRSPYDIIELSKNDDFIPTLRRIGLLEEV